MYFQMASTICRGVGRNFERGVTSTCKQSAVKTFMASLGVGSGGGCAYQALLLLACSIE